MYRGGNLMEEELKRAILLDHYQDPHNKGLKNDEGYLSVHNASDSCIDDITVQVKIVDEVILDVCYDGIGCTICIASCSIMSDMLKGKTIKEAKNILQNYFNMINETGSFDPDLLEEANAFDTLSKQANRIKCGTIGVKAMDELIDEYERTK